MAHLAEHVPVTTAGGLQAPTPETPGDTDRHATYPRSFDAVDSAIKDS